ncbi:hypothetical protein Goshw_025889 [Gossypium schwendimanii]|uniref:Uncharacterized protein n=1 Tax=Gossypium schwendimanii TaxID=34291 RepID=A0A7J9MKR6_GOSSC|nr:hypothetical protein [Gossypium schwendimanii]
MSPSFFTLRAWFQSMEYKSIRII